MSSRINSSADGEPSDSSGDEVPLRILRGKQQMSHQAATEPGGASSRDSKNGHGPETGDNDTEAGPSQLPNKNARKRQGSSGGPSASEPAS
ncbi:hypothetical protein PG991_012102 [Apiospora marii]|uniref:Uncharacterized protein n=1 Tax=Apiospora marii TaxID=335849 RepID=A0ABR1RG29_9PEZI